MFRVTSNNWYNDKKFLVGTAVSIVLAGIGWWVHSSPSAAITNVPKNNGIFTQGQHGDNIINNNGPSKEPKLDSAGPKIRLDATPPIVSLDFHNSGGSTAKRGAVRLIGLNEARTSRRELGKGDIIGAGTNVLRDYNGHAEIRVAGELPDLFLACTVYYDDDNKTSQKAFLFRMGDVRNNEAPLNELETPYYHQICNQ
jgi:hypothetical protein